LGSCIATAVTTAAV
jgi:hypothetical protein